MARNANLLPEDRHPLDDDMQEIQEFVRRCEEERRRNATLPWSEDPLFKDVPIYDGPAPSDLSERHDYYLYGDKD
jgi:hypothetical protein